VYKVETYLYLGILKYKTINQQAKNKQKIEFDFKLNIIIILKETDLKNN
jgi:hypothetical protein